jgi:hypothetical protein
VKLKTDSSSGNTTLQARKPSSPKHPAFPSAGPGVKARNASSRTAHGTARIAPCCEDPQASRYLPGSDHGDSACSHSRRLTGAPRPGSQRERKVPAGTTSTSSHRATMRAASAVMLVSGLLSVPASAAQADVSPLPASNYSVRSACSTPAPGRASCLAVQLLPVTAAARAHDRPLGLSSQRPLAAGASAAEGAYGLRPWDFHRAYLLPSNAPSAQTIGIVDAYDDPSAEHDLAVYDREFGLPECTTANGCFSKINQNGGTSPLPAVSSEWSMEVALDVETAHAICQNCRIVLVEAESNSDAALEAAENRAALAGATEITNSWGAAEPLADSAAFNHPGIVVTAAAGDNGYLSWDAWWENERGSVLYPAASPHVVAVGSTRLTLKPGSEWAGESVWNNADGASGGGCSSSFAAPPWQRDLPNWSGVGCGAGRAVADVAADGDPYTGAAVYDSTPWSGYVLGWLPVGGTSLSSPLIAAVYALAGGAHGQAYPAQGLYENAVFAASTLHQITSGSNGECLAASGASGESGCSAAQAAASCGGRAVCMAGAPYSGAAGVGTPSGLGAFQPGNGSFGASTSEAGAVGGQNGTDAGGGSGAAAAGEAGAAPPASGRTRSHHARPRHSSTRVPGVRLSSLRLTRRALAALHRSHASTTGMSFSFTLNAPSPVRVSLDRLTTAGARKDTATRARAGALTSSFELAARKGRNQWSMRGTGTLVPGRYRLTVAPAAGAARSLVIVVR